MVEEDGEKDGVCGEVEGMGEVCCLRFRRLAGAGAGANGIVFSGIWGCKVYKSVRREINSEEFFWLSVLGS